MTDIYVVRNKEDSDIEGAVESKLAPAPLLPNYGGLSGTVYNLDMGMMGYFNAQEFTILQLKEILENTGWRLTRCTPINAKDNFLRSTVAVPIQHWTSPSCGGILLMSSDIYAKQGKLSQLVESTYLYLKSGTSRTFENPGYIEINNTFCHKSGDGERNLDFGNKETKESAQNTAVPSRGIEPRAAVLSIRYRIMKDSNVSHYTTMELLTLVKTRHSRYARWCTTFSISHRLMAGIWTAKSFADPSLMAVTFACPLPWSLVELTYLGA
ncbi:hypothetical protein K435DRAFT_791659 [Dendrothele bispora CBS 962.96]|uniref:Uncharacterized protein n=1 Tax=Dendrothele bispora (strain CBS 962.96) TaxID=1314807 RepID=A0A4S8MM65_DENBC|nr:hypothetical protein K435DRAFT_791659 [Dendrothele bispora CBS 962.96]